MRAAVKLTVDSADVGDNYPAKAGKPKKVTSSHDKR